MVIAPAVYKKIVAGKLYMDQYYHEPISLHSISRKACISRFHFHRLFTKVYRRTPHQYLIKRRIGHAAQLLEKENLSISDVCNLVGFESIGSFSVLFKKETGMTPSNYRAAFLQKKEQARSNPSRFIPGCFIESSQRL